MKNDYSYGWEKLHNAMYCLIGPGDQRDRLANAVSTVSVLIIRPEEQYLPEEIQTEVINLLLGFRGILSLQLNEEYY